VLFQFQVISEGAGRGANRQFKRFLEISMGSINEVQTQVELAYRVNYLEKDIYESLIDEALQIYRMILAFYNSLKGVLNTKYYELRNTDSGKKAF